MIVLNKETVLRNARQAYLDGRLQALHVSGAKTSGCRYRDDENHCCAIGASLDDQTAALFDSIGPVGVRALRSNSRIETDNIYFLSELQNAHDRMMIADNAERRERCHQELREILQVEGEPNPA